jgi:hypothetical protein
MLTVRDFASELDDMDGRIKEMRSAVYDLGDMQCS